MVTKRLQMTFLNELGGRVSLSVNSPKDTLTALEIDQAMANIIAKNIFTSRGGSLVQAAGAKIITQETMV